MRAWLTAGLLIPVLLAAAPVEAVKYTGMKEAVQSVLGSETNLLQQKFTLTDEQVAFVKKATGWSPRSRQVKFYFVRDPQEKITGYATFMTGFWEDQASSRHILCIGLDPDGGCTGVVVVELTDPYAFPINRKSFLKQFVGLASDRSLEQAHQVDAITGATGSCILAADLVLRAQAIFRTTVQG